MNILGYIPRLFLTSCWFHISLECGWIYTFSTSITYTLNKSSVVEILLHWSWIEFIPTRPWVYLSIRLVKFYAIWLCDRLILDEYRPRFFFLHYPHFAQLRVKSAAWIVHRCIAEQIATCNRHAIHFIIPVWNVVSYKNSILEMCHFEWFFLLRFSLYFFYFYSLVIFWMPCK